MSARSEHEIEEAVRLRAPPPRIARLSRPVILTAAGLGLLGVGAALALALQTRAPKPVVIKAEDASSRPAPVAATGPKTYAEIPKLGPPLPGDLGRPIVSAQTRGQTVDPPPVGTSPPRNERAQTLTAARSSSLFFGQPHASAPNAQPPEVPSAPTPISLPTMGADTSLSKSDFLDARGSPPTASAFRVEPPAGRLILQAQTIIPAALLTAVNSDLPGPIAAQVTRNVYDSLTGRTVLIPQGSRLIGAYDSRLAYGQKRLLLAWDRVIFPDGRSLRLDRLVGADAAGRSGLTDKVDAHWGAMAKAALLSSVLGVGAEIGSGSDDDLARALRGGAQDTLNQTGQQLVRKQLDIQPTLTLRAGLPLTILVTRDMVFDPPAP